MRLPLAFLILLGGAGCKQTTAPERPPLELVAAAGDLQYGTAGTELAQALVVLAREPGTGLPGASVTLRWVVTAGDATVLGPEARVTDEAGFSEVRVRLGNTLGPVEVTATLVDRGGATATLRSFVVGSPELTGVEPASAAPGASMVLEGENFSPVAEQNLVYFSDIRARVTSATPTRLEVTVPACLPPRSETRVRVALGSVSSAERPVEVTGPGASTSMAVGGVLDLSDPKGLDCVRLPGDGGARYLVVARSASTLAAARHPYRLAGLWYRPVTTAPLAAPTHPGRLVAAGQEAPEDGRASLQAALDAALREEEARLVEGRAKGVPDPSAPLAAPARAPTVGEAKTFWVYNGSENLEDRFDRITATARHIGQHAVIYVDDAAPEDGFVPSDFQAIGARFDQVIHPTVTGVFGAPSDLDRNERIAILFTPVVNRLTPRDSNSFVGGFFYGRDLLPELPNSNRGEVFYALVPDPQGDHSGPRSRSMVLGAVPSILAHEFQHMIHFNQRALRTDGSQDALWMQEGLAQMAEELVARAYDERAAPNEAELFRDGNRRRARIHLERPDTVSLVISSGRGNLAERGAGFLFLLHLHQHEGADLLRRLTRSTRTGVDNVVAETGRGWADLVADWTAALYLDETSFGTGRASYPGFDLPGFLGSPSPLRPLPINPGDFLFASELASSSMRYILLTPPSDGTLTLGFGGSGGGPHGEAAAAALRIVRLQ